MDYYPYGDIRLDEKAGTFNEQRKYAGQEYDADTGLSYMNARYYNGKMGRFVSVDPAFWNTSRLDVQLVDPQSWNSYSYARNNPLMYNDPDGQFWDVVDYLQTGADTLRYGKNLMTATAGSINIAIGEYTHNDKLTRAGDAQLAKGVQGMKEMADDLAVDGAGLAIPFVPISALKAVKNTNNAGRSVTRFINGVEIKYFDKTFKGTVDLQPTLERIEKGVKYPHRNDGAIYKNKEGFLPVKSGGYYKEFVHPTPGMKGPGAQRIIQGKGGELYYSPDHYQTPPIRLDK